MLLRQATGPDRDATDHDYDHERATGDRERTGRDGERPRQTPAVSGPHVGRDRYGDLDHYYWRCERCGHESVDAALTEGCPECERERHEGAR